MIDSENIGLILDQINPMAVVLSGTGHILHAGPTLQKLRPVQDMAGLRFLEVFELTRPRSINSMRELLGASGTRLHLRFRDAPQTGLKGTLVPLQGSDTAIVNLSLGISVLDAVQDYALTSADFADTDLTIELLYLVEAKSAAMEASRKLNQRLQGARIAAEEQAFTDTLTGLKNRRAMDHVLDRRLAAEAPFGLMHLDLDYFKSVNDTLGHAAGDHVLQQVAQIMVAEIRDSDTVARVGGDEFVLIFERLMERDALDGVACRLIEQLQAPIPFEGQMCRISASIGTVMSNEFDSPTAAELLNAADLALYAAKNAGRGRHVFYAQTSDGCLATPTGDEGEPDPSDRIQENPALGTGRAAPG